MKFTENEKGLRDKPRRGRLLTAYTETYCHRVDDLIRAVRRVKTRELTAQLEWDQTAVHMTVEL